MAADDELDLGLDSDPDLEDDFYDQDGPGLFGDDDAGQIDDVHGSSEPVDEDEDDAPLPEVTAPTEDVAPAERPSAELPPAELPPSGLAPPPAPDRGPRQELPEAPLALYRRYRPDTFDDVIGQEHVTEPLQRALVNNRVNHAYLFSGPRGCGKTTSARILARALNCEKGPTPTPCGECQSCRDLARGGGGSIDVIEIDAASHGGVDDARDLRERAFFAPVHSRYKIYIVDEAHMVTTAGFNAMLKLVEEPPPHVKFIFATTEPDKVIGTIRSRTHHYPFRLVPPKVLTAYLGTLCEAEGVAIDPAVLPLVVRAGAGSVRDSLSVLDQLLGGAGEDGVSYHQATALLGYTPDALLDEVMDAFAAGDARSVFAAVDKVIEVGQDPRRFAEDLLRRLRDLVIVGAVPDAVSSGLIDVAADQAERLAVQAQGMGPGELTRAAEVIATGLTEMRGTTAPRLHLELMCARVLLPGADVDERGVHARLDRLERRIADTGVAVAPRPQTAEPAAPRQQWTDTEAAPPAPTHPATEQAGPPARPDDHPAETPAPQRRTQRPAMAQAPAPEPTPEPAAALRPSGDPAAIDVTRVRSQWPQVLEAVKGRRRFTWMILTQHAQVLDVQGGALTLGFSNPGARENFNSSGSSDILRDCIVEVLSADLAIVPIVDGGDHSAGPGTAPDRGGQGAPTGQPAADRGPSQSTPREPTPPAQRGGSPDSPESPDSPGPPSSPTGEPTETERPRQSSHGAAAREQIRPMSTAPTEPETDEEGDDLADPDDVVLDDGVGSASELIVKHLGAELIAEEDR
ncbi:DNA polymerase III subunit gamma and tau [Aestuariimicrobium ganziense]|uniref:DNA polymerase III subunit gamma and tau n=1 Tax=Aestuariimicrobium ganziense TaxID=2773677 RepID=UPI0019428DB8|nr:DNA polymerase III subunit gamma and tau [Aestuariimicrobium ganziense]